MKYIVNNWDLEQIIAISYHKAINWTTQFKAIERYENYDTFAKNAFDAKQGNFFDDEEKNTNIFQFASNQIKYANDNGYKIITIWDAEYPVLLKDIFNPPTLLFISGNLQHADSLSIAVVGTRKCTPYGKNVTELFVKEFVKNNIIIASGLATGIDTVAHNTAIRNAGITYAIIASGLDKLNSMNKQLANEIVNGGGAVISEFKFGTQPLQGYFLQRNRIISGISKATLIVESAYKGGSLNTAQHAFDQNRDLYAIPGSILSEKSYGTNHLINVNKAVLALSPKTLLNDICNLKIDSAKNEIKFNSKEEELIYNKLTTEPIHIDELSSLTNLQLSELHNLLLEMEFSDLVKQQPGKYYIKFK